MSRKIYIVLSDSGTIPSRVIRMATRYAYGHAMLALSEDCEELYSFGRKKLHNFLCGGFVIEQRDGQFFTHFSETKCRVLALSVTQAQFDALKREIMHFCENIEQYKYDFLGCFLRYFHMRKTFADRYTCSHFVAEVLQRAGICSFPNGTMLVRPEDFVKISNIETIYEGRFCDLPRRDPINKNKKVRLSYV